MTSIVFKSDCSKSFSDHESRSVGSVCSSSHLWRFSLVAAFYDKVAERGSSAKAVEAYSCECCEVELCLGSSWILYAIVKVKFNPLLFIAR